MYRSFLAFILFFPLLSSCVFSSAREENRYRRFSAELPPCRLPSLSEEEVLEIAKRALGKHFSMEGMPEPNRRIREFRCIYIYEQSSIYFSGKPASLDVPDAKYMIFISRDGLYMD
jgi:hypothetical protein